MKNTQEEKLDELQGEMKKELKEILKDIPANYNGQVLFGS